MECVEKRTGPEQPRRSGESLARQVGDFNFRFNKLLIQIQSKCKICNKTTNFLKTVILIHAFVKIMNSIRSVKTISAV